MAEAGGAAGAWAKAKPEKTRQSADVDCRIDGFKKLNFKFDSVVGKWITNARTSLFSRQGD
jgi:hypothetical protein